jgi:hypothetical protein
LNLTLTHDGHRLDVEGSEGQGPAQITLNGETHTLTNELSVASSPQVLAIGSAKRTNQ